MMDKHLHKKYAYDWEHINPEELALAGHKFLERFNEKDYPGTLDFFNRLIPHAQDYIKKKYHMEYILTVSEMALKRRE